MKKRIIKIFSMFIVGILLLIIGLFVFIYFSENGKITFPVSHKYIFSESKIKNFPELLSVNGKNIINKNGQVVTLKGVNIVNPVKLHCRNKFNKELFKEISDTKSNVIRIPVNPESWLQDEDYMWRYLDSAVKWAGEYDMYVIIDLHFIGNIVTGVGEQMPDIDSPKDFTYSFWEKVSTHFKDVPNVLFEIYNEPNDISENTWRKCASDIVDIIRSTGANQIIIVSGTEYSSNLSWVINNPIDSHNIAYACHIYPGNNIFLWSNNFGNISNLYPVIMTEWGYIDEHRDTTNQNHLIGDKDSYGIPLMNYLEDRNISWVSWVYDDLWEPQMFTKGFKEYTNFGKYVIEKLNENE